MFQSAASEDKGAGSAPAAAPAAAAAAGMSGKVDNTGASPLAGFLVSFSQDGNGVFWPIRYGKTYIGSGADNDIVLPFPDVSGEHTMIQSRAIKGTPKAWCSDLKSTNGTFLNGDDIVKEDPDIATGDVIKVGPVELRVVLLDS
jgi:pSer/pThr/pTyr-binding forkhead associated (FHA) protein